MKIRIPWFQNLASALRRIDSLDCVTGVGRMSKGGGGRMDDILWDAFKVREKSSGAKLLFIATRGVGQSLWLMSRTALLFFLTSFDSTSSSRPIFEFAEDLITILSKSIEYQWIVIRYKTSSDCK